MEVVTIGLDISKHVFHVHAIDAQRQVTGRQHLRRGEIGLPRHCRAFQCTAARF